MTTYLSIDVATKSLAIGLYQIQSTDDIDNKIIPLAMDVFDLDSEKSLRI